jgi:DNA-binding transcriptional MerR regulator
MSVTHADVSSPTAATPRAAEPAVGVVGPDGARWALRMKDLSEATGLSRQVIHYYIREGLLPPGEKATRNSAFYGQVHLDRLTLIRRLQQERFLPLRAIRAVLEGEGGAFSAEQRAWLAELKATTTSALLQRPGQVQRVEVAPLLTESGVEQRDFDALVRLGLLGAVTDTVGTIWVAADDAWLIAFVGEMRRTGLTSELGFHVEDLAMYEEAIDGLFHREAEVLMGRLTRFRAEEAGPLLERVLPLVNQFLARYHEARIRRFLDLMT